jgi:hypothetical protein
MIGTLQGADFYGRHENNTNNQLITDALKWLSEEAMRTFLNICVKNAHNQKNYAILFTTSFIITCPG